MVYVLKDIIASGIKMYNINSSHSLNESQKKGLDIIIDAYNNKTVSIVQGPPGTGKTTLLESTIDTLLNKLDKGETLIYVAPTNYLVYNTLERILPILMKQYGIQDIPKVLRVFGSSFDYGSLERLRAPIDKDVKIVLTTDYQKFYVEFKKIAEGNRGISLNLLIDEASRSPIFRAFTPIAIALEEADKNSYNLSVDSLSVVGDPMQAISIKELYRHRRDLLLIVKLLTHKVESIDPTLANELRNGGSAKLYEVLYSHDLINKLDHYSMLDTTYRVPAPSHLIISEGFYGGMLKAARNSKQEVYIRKHVNKEDFLKFNAKLVEGIINALDSRKGIIYIDVKGMAYGDPQGDNIDEYRAAFAVQSAILLSTITERNTSILPLYRDMKYLIEYMLQDYTYHPYLTKLVNAKISVETSHAMLGGEDDNVVVVMGKEYVKIDYDNKYASLYFEEPEIFNVQFSRHKGVIVIIGNIERLLRNANQLLKKAGRTKIRELSFYAENAKLLKNAAIEILDLCGISAKGSIERKSDECEVIQINIH